MQNAQPITTLQDKVLPYRIRLRFEREEMCSENETVQPKIAHGLHAADLVRRMVAAEDSGNTIEYFYALYLNVQGLVSDVIKVSQGTLTSSIVHPREVFRPALLTNCASIIVAHNHPSGDVTPSPNDNALTRRLKRAGKILGIELIDHIIVADNDHYSYCQSGTL